MWVPLQRGTSFALIEGKTTMEGELRLADYLPGRCRETEDNYG